MAGWRKCIASTILEETKAMQIKFRPIRLLHLAFCLLIPGWMPANAASLLVRGGTLIDGTGGAPIANARILITDGVIARVWSGDAAAPALPSDTLVVEAGGKFIIPGLIDSHVHY